MCIFAGPVKAVSNTRIAVFTKGKKCFTIYQMNVELLEGGNAMVLPVPVLAKKKVKLVDMSGAKGFFSDLDDLWPKPRFRGINLDALLSSEGPLAVKRVGDYEVSIVRTIEDIKRIDTSVFTLSPETEGVLREQYTGENWAFVVAKLVAGGEVHPLGYIYRRANPAMVFIPTRHAHGHSEPDKGYTSDWDHTVYVPAGARFEGPLPGMVQPMEATAACYEATAGFLLAETSELKGFLDPSRKFGRVQWKGWLPNVDARFTV